MIRLILSLIRIVTSGNAFASAADDTFDLLAQNYVGDLTAITPADATLIGDHGADDKLDDVSADAHKAYVNYLTDIAAMDRDDLSRTNQVDIEILRSEIESELWALDSLQEWAWNPLVYIDNKSGNSIYGLVARDFAPLEQRLLAAASRLEQLPRFLDQAPHSPTPRARVQNPC